MLLFLLLVSANAPKIDFGKYKGLELQSSTGGGKAVAKEWKALPSDGPAQRYALKRDPPPLFTIPVDNVLLIVHKKSSKVAGFAFALSFANCINMWKVLDQKWGKSTYADGVRQWKDEKADVTLEHESQDKCALLVTDRSFQD